MNIFGGGSYNSGGWGSNPIGDPVSKTVEKKVREITEKTAEIIHPKLGEVVRDVNRITDKLRNNTDVFTGNELNNKVIPVRGSILYCSLGLGYAEHSGIYIGGGKIVELNGNGKIIAVNAKQFTGNITTVDNTIYVSSAADGSQAIGKNKVADMAQQMLSTTRSYNLLMDNCHQFTAGCVLGNFENPNNFLWLLKEVVEKEMNDGKPVQWVAWDWRQ